jgi:hypothetical protein
MPSLNTRTRLAIIGMTADHWCPVSLWKTLHKDLDHHMENLQTNGWVDTKFCHHGFRPSIAPEKQNVDAQDELSHKQAGC